MSEYDSLHKNFMHIKYIDKTIVHNLLLKTLVIKGVIYGL